MATAVHLDDALETRLARVAASTDRSTESVMREAIREYLDRADLKADFHAEALASWSEFQETGLYLTWQETSDWLDTWGTPEEKPAPPCHS